MTTPKEFVQVKARTPKGTAVHYGFKSVEEVPRVGLYCLSGRTYAPVEVPADTEVTCKWCAPLGRIPGAL